METSLKVAAFFHSEMRPFSWSKCNFHARLLFIVISFSAYFRVFESEFSWKVLKSNLQFDLQVFTIFGNFYYFGRVRVSGCHMQVIVMLPLRNNTNFSFSLSFALVFSYEFRVIVLELRLWDHGIILNY